MNSFASSLRHSSAIVALALLFVGDCGAVAAPPTPRSDGAVRSASDWLERLPKLPRPIRFAASFTSQHHDAKNPPDAPVDHGAIEIDGVMTPDTRFVLTLTMLQPAGSGTAEMVTEIAWDGDREYSRTPSEPGTLLVRDAARPPIPPRATKLGMLLQHTDAFGDLRPRVAADITDWTWCDRIALMEEGSRRTLTLETDGPRFVSRFVSTLECRDDRSCRLVEYSSTGIDRTPDGAAPLRGMSYSVQGRQWKEFDGHTVAMRLVGLDDAGDHPELAGRIIESSATLHEIAWLDGAEFDEQLAEFMSLRTGERLYDETLKLAMRSGDHHLAIDGIVYELAEPLFDHPGDALPALLESAVRLEPPPAPPGAPDPASSGPANPPHGDRATHDDDGHADIRPAALAATSLVLIAAGAALFFRRRGTHVDHD